MPLTIALIVEMMTDVKQVALFIGISETLYTWALIWMHVQFFIPKFL